MAEPVTTPYVGPRPFEEGDSDRFFGRSQEIRQLASLIVARRVVVLCARSGAGKTSLLRAGLIPHLRDNKKLQVLPVARVGGESPCGTAAKTVGNRYVLNILCDLLGDRLPAGETLPQTLLEGLKRLLITPQLPPRPEDPTDRDISSPADSFQGPCLLILDQLEELFSLHPELHHQRADLFVQLRHCLEELPRLSLLLSLREDSIAQLETYAAYLPDRLRSRFRLELLNEEAALQAMQLPAQHSGDPLSDATAQRLVDELRTVQIQHPDGHSEKVLGPWVEPVHLQVVCQRQWWQSSNATQQPLDTAYIRAENSVDDALASFYYEQVAAVAASTGHQERPLRDWIERRLITEQGLRGQVQQGVQHSEGLPNRVILALVEAHLVRVEERRGATWFELAHDRLVAPVLASNAAWRRLHLRPGQHRASLWLEEGRPRSLLLRGAELRSELAWARTHSGQLTADERQFLADARQERRVRRLGTLVVAGILILVASLGLFQRERNNRRRELARGLAAQAMGQFGERLDLGLLLSLEANRLGPPTAEARSSLLAGLEQQPHLLSFLHGHSAVVWAVAWSPKSNATGKTVLASGGLDHQVLLWDTDRRQRLGEPLVGHTDGVLSLAWSPDGQRLVSTGRDGLMLLWDVAQDPPKERLLSPGRIITSAQFRDQDHLLTGDTNHQVLAWDLRQDPSTPRLLGQHADWVTSLAVHPTAPRRLVSGGADNRIQLWSEGVQNAQQLRGHSDWVTGLAWSTDGKILTSASLDHTLRRWNMETFEELPRPQLEGPTNRFSGVAISADGQVLAAATANGLITLWDVATGSSLGPPMPGNLALMRSLAFSPQGRILATTNGPSVTLWDLAETGTNSALGRPLGGGQGEVRAVAFSPDGSLIAASLGGDQGEIRLLDRSSGRLRGTPLTGFPEAAQGIAWSADGQTLAAFGDDEEFKEVRLFDLQTLATTTRLREPIPQGIGHDPDRRALQRTGDFAQILEKTLEPQHSEKCVTVRTLTSTRDGETMAAESAPTAGAGSWVERWNLTTGQSAQRQIEVTECVRSLALSGDGELLAVGTDEGAIALLTTAALDPRNLLEGHVLAVRSVAISPDGQLLASAGDEGIVRLWDLTASTPHGHPLVGHTDTIYALTFDPKGQVLASAGRDRTILLWDLTTRTPIGRPLRGHSGPVWSLDFGPTGDHLVSGGQDGTRLWELGFEAWRKRACRIANRNLSEEEWNLFVGNAARPEIPACPGAPPR